MRKVKNSQRRPCEIRLDEPQLQPCRLDQRAFECYLRVTNWSCVFVLFDTSGELLSGKVCLLIHLSASTPAEDCESSALFARLSDAQSWAHVYSVRAHRSMNNICFFLLRNCYHGKVQWCNSWLDLPHPWKRASLTAVNALLLPFYLYDIAP